MAGPVWKTNPLRVVARHIVNTKRDIVGPAKIDDNGKQLAKADEAGTKRCVLAQE